MQTASAQPAAVLDYASSRPQEAVLRRLRGAVIVLIFVLLGAGAGWYFDPRMYRAVGYLMVEPTQITPSADVQSLDANQVQAQQAAAVAGVAGSANAQVVATQLPSSMNVTAAMVMANLKVQAIPQSRLVAVSYVDDNPRVVAAVVNVAIGRYASPGVNVAAVATPPTQPLHGWFYLLGGATVGFVLGLFIVAFRWK